MAQRWINGWRATEEEWNSIAEIIERNGWIPLNRQTTRILLEEDDDGILLGFLVLQLVAHIEPVYVQPCFRGMGIPERLAKGMNEYLTNSNARVFMATAENRFSEKLCESIGMKRVESPVFSRRVE